MTHRKLRFDRLRWLLQIPSFAVLHNGMLIEERTSQIGKRSPRVAPEVLKICTGGSMRIVAVSPFENAKEEEILRFLAKLPRALIVLPGHSANTPHRVRFSV